MRRVLFATAIAALPLTGAAQQDGGVPLSLVPVQGNVHMLVGAGPNITVQAGEDGIVLVDTPPAALVPQVQAELRKLSPRPVRMILNTSMDPEHVAGNAAFVPAPARGTGGAPFGALGLARPAIIAHEAVLNRLSAATPPTPPTALPTTTYYLPSMDLHINGEPVFLYHQATAHTDGDSLILFRSSNVVSTGDIYTPNRYPVIDRARGGSVQGIIAGLNRVLAITVPAAFQEGGTMVIPGHGRLSDEADVVEYRDMVTIVRDRIQDLTAKGRTLEQIKAARPSRDYDNEYGAANADAFVEAVYRSLTENKGRS